MQRLHSQLKSALGVLFIFSICNLGAAYDPSMAPGGCSPAPTPPECSLTGSAWKTVDNLAVSKGNSWLGGAATSKTASYVVGTYDPIGDGGDSRWIVRRSLDRGETWATVDTFTTHPDQQFGAVGVATDPRNGHVYVMGGAMSQVSGIPWAPWVVRKSTNDGTTWTTVDTYNLSGHFVGPMAISVDGKGVIYVAGVAVEVGEFGEKGRHGILRRSADGGATWTDQHFPEYTDLRLLAATRDGHVFVGGPNPSPTVSPYLPFSISYSPTGTGGWSVADRYPEGKGTLLYGLQAHTDGRVAAFGEELNGDTYFWFMRETKTSAPLTWTQTDRYQPLDFSIGFGDASARSATFSKAGVIYASGYQKHPNRSDIEFITREGNPPSTLFYEVDRLSSYPASLGGMGEGRTISATTEAGDILTAFQKPTDGMNPNAWVVRKLECK